MTIDNRSQPRRPENHSVALVARGKTYGTARIMDLSSSGARLVLSGRNRSVPNAFTMVLSYTPRIARDCVVVWQRGGSIGVKFIEPERTVRPANWAAIGLDDEEK